MTLIDAINHLEDCIRNNLKPGMPGVAYQFPVDDKGSARWEYLLPDDEKPKLSKDTFENREGAKDDLLKYCKVLKSRFYDEHGPRAQQS
jgi:hypothetical protein